MPTCAAAVSRRSQIGYSEYGRTFVPLVKVPFWGVEHRQYFQ